MKPACPAPQALRFADDGRVPNHPRYPALLYRAVLAEAGDLAAAFEALFAANHWPPQWRDGVYPWHHFHAQAHEAFGIARGEARLLLGGERGEEVTIAAGDALVLPAGTGHCRVWASEHFLAVGAYPRGARVDMRRAADASARAAILAVPMPAADPVGGEQGPLMRLWKPA
jgi:uncharacterized protein YjlB